MQQLSSSWTSFVSRLRKEAGQTLANNKDGIAVIHLTLFVDHNGDPAIWWIDKSTRVEPSSRAKSTLQRILSPR